MQLYTDEQYIDEYDDEHEPARYSPSQGQGANASPESTTIASYNKAEKFATAQKHTIQWLLDNYQIMDGESYPKAEVYQDYLHFCTQGDMEPTTAPAFGKIIRMAFPNLQCRRKGPRGEAKHHYRNFSKRSRARSKDEILPYVPRSERVLPAIVSYSRKRSWENALIDTPRSPPAKEPRLLKLEPIEPKLDGENALGLSAPAKLSTPPRDCFLPLLEAADGLTKSPRSDGLTSPPHSSPPQYSFSSRINDSDSFHSPMAHTHTMFSDSTLPILPPLSSLLQGSMHSPPTSSSAPSSQGKYTNRRERSSPVDKVRGNTSDHYDKPQDGTVITDSFAVHRIPSPESPEKTVIAQPVQTAQSPLVVHKRDAVPLVLRWIKCTYERIEGSEFADVPKEEVYGNYKQFCKEHDIQFTNSATFGKLLRAVFPDLKTRRLGSRGNTKHHYNGIRARNPPLPLDGDTSRPIMIASMMLDRSTYHTGSPTTDTSSPGHNVYSHSSLQHNATPRGSGSPSGQSATISLPGPVLAPSPITSLLPSVATPIADKPASIKILPSSSAFSASHQPSSTVLAPIPRRVLPGPSKLETSSIPRPVPLLPLIPFPTRNSTLSAILNPCDNVESSPLERFSSGSQKAVLTE